MRALILVAGALALALPLGACKNNNQSDNTTNVDESMAAENIVSNDVTAIDAVTGDAANMAAESPISDINAENVLDTANSGNSGNASVAAKPAATRPASARPAAKKPAATAPTPATPAPTPVSNAVTNAAQ